MDVSIALILLQDGITSGAIYALLALAVVLVFSSRSESMPDIRVRPRRFRRVRTSTARPKRAVEAAENKRQDAEEWS
jgi:hypothetical protein